MRSQVSVRTVLAAAAVSAVIAAGGATAANQLIQSKDIAKHAVKSRNIANQAVTQKKLSNGVRDQLRTPGPQGERGPQGPVGPQGAAGQDAEFKNPQWSVIARNTIGSPSVVLSGGPYTSDGASGFIKPPYGQGSLQMQVSTLGGQEKAAFGDEVDFFGDPFSGLSELGFQFFQTGESSDIAPGNAPSLGIEINPNLESSPSVYSTAVFTPDPSVVPASTSWSDYVDATDSADGEWWLTGAAGAATGCAISSPCDFDGLQSALDDGGAGATIYSVQVTKGRDNAWNGAVDGLRVNGSIYDFEAFGVEVRSAS